MAAELSALLGAARCGDSHAFAEAFEAAYSELRRLARRQLRMLRPGETLATTTLVHEAYLKLVRRPIA
jgi:DNA-directed RNA polymerase specialized sigma24 family protein